MNLSIVVGLIVIIGIVIFGIMFLVRQADKRRKTQQLANKTAKKAEVAANRAAWEKWRNK